MFDISCCEMSDLEIVFIFLIGTVVESIECRPALGGGLVNEGRLFNEGHLGDALPEIALVDGRIPNGLIELLQLCEGEEWWQEVESYGLATYHSLELVNGRFYHVLMVEQQWGKLVQVGPIGRVVMVQFLIDLGDVDQGKVGNGNNTVATVAADGAKSTYLFQVDMGEAGEFEEHALGCSIDILVLLNETTHQRPFTAMGLKVTFLQEQFQAAILKTEDDAVHGNVELGVATIKG